MPTGFPIWGAVKGNTLFRWIVWKLGKLNCWWKPKVPSPETNGKPSPIEKYLTQSLIGPFLCYWSIQNSLSLLIGIACVLICHYGATGVLFDRLFLLWVNSFKQYIVLQFNLGFFFFFLLVTFYWIVETFVLQSFTKSEFCWLHPCYVI